MSKLLWIAALLLVASTANAAKFTVKWVNPTKDTKGADLVSLSRVMIEWGTCSGSDFGEFLGATFVNTTVPGAQLSQVLTTDSNTNGLAKLCVRAYAYNTEGTPSDPSNVAVKTLLPSPGKPVTLDKPIILNFN